MTRKAELTADEIFKAEQAKEARQKNRSKGFKKMAERDKSWQKLKNYYSGEVLIEWPVNAELEEGEIRTNIPEGMVVLKIDNKTALLDTEELRRWLRWA